MEAIAKRETAAPPSAVSPAHGNRTTVAELRALVYDFLRVHGNHAAQAVAAAYARMTKDANRAETIIDSLGLDWSTLSGDLRARLKTAYEDGGEQAMLAVIDAPTDEMFGALNTGAIKYAQERAAQLVTDITETTRDGLRSLIEDAFTEGMTPSQLATEIADSYGFSSERAELIARTEIGMAHVEGALDGWTASGVVEGKYVVLSADHTNEDDCDDAESEGTVPLDDDFGGLGDPPFHPNCECSLVPVVGDVSEESEE
jgi:hypothetical protein